MSTIVDRNGATATVRYWPYGATRSTTGTVGTDKLYTGQQQEPDDPALGLYNYGARFYSTTLGRFASVDPVVGSAGDPQSWNGYAYVRNNPLRYTDPTGMDPVCFITCVGTPDQVVVEDEKCHACWGKSPAEVEAIRQGMIAGAIFQALRTIDTHRQVTGIAGLKALADASARIPNTYIDWGFIASCSDASECARQVVGYGGEGSRKAPAAANVAVEAIPYIGDGRALTDPSLSVGYAIGVGLTVSPLPGDRAGARVVDDVVHDVNWTRVAASAEPATRKSWRGVAISVEETYEHSRTGERVVRHYIAKGSEIIHDHLRIAPW